MKQSTFEVDPKAMGERLKLTRTKLSLTQENMAEAVDISVNFYGGIERGEKKPSLKTLGRLSEVLGESVDYLLTGKANSNKDVPIVRHYNSLTPAQRKAAEDMFELWIKSIHYESYKEESQ